MTRLRTLGSDPQFKAAIELACRVAPSRSPVLLVGPTGAGKSHLARLIHERGAHPDSSFNEWHAGAAPESLIETELLGVRRGAATGVEGRAGLFEAVGQGTVCLVGVELLQPHQQAILLRTLEERCLTRVGGGGPVRLEARVLACFSEPPEDLVHRGALRADLFYRLDVIRIDIPPLSHHAADVPLFAEHFLKSACRKLRKPVPEVSAGLHRVLAAYPWPGNLRELAQRMEGLAHSSSDPLTEEDLPSGFWLPTRPVGQALDRRLTLEELKDAYIRAVLARVDGNRTQAARWLGISRKALWDHLRRDKEGV